MPANADVQNGDVLVTSGLDGVFLAGFPVAKVVRIERDASYSFCAFTACRLPVSKFRPSDGARPARVAPAPRSAFDRAFRVQKRAAPRKNDPKRDSNELLIPHPFTGSSVVYFVESADRAALKWLANI